VKNGLILLVIYVIGLIEFPSGLAELVIRSL
jgi:hypothetical protein